MVEKFAHFSLRKNYLLNRKKSEFLTEQIIKHYDSSVWKLLTDEVFVDVTIDIIPASTKFHASFVLITVIR